MFYAIFFNEDPLPLFQQGGGFLRDKIYYLEAFVHVCREMFDKQSNSYAL